MKVDTMKIIKIAGVVMGVAGTLIASWVGDKENDSKLEQLVSDRLDKEGES